MSSGLIDNPATADGRSVRPSLLRAEARRFAARRFIRVLLAVAALGYAAMLVIGFTQYARTTPEVLADAQRRIGEMVQQNEQYRQQCLAERATAGDVSPENFCGPVTTAADYGDQVSYFVDKQPFNLATEGLDGAQATAFLTVALAFLIGATFIGAEWGSRSLVALLFWEPRRRRVMGAKLAVLATAVTALAGAAQAAWWAGAKLLAAQRGSAEVPPGFWGDYLGTAGRGVFVTLVAGLLGFGLAHAVRHTAAALGIGFAYFAILESLIRAFRPAWQPWLLTDNALAFVQHLPYTVYLDSSYTDERGMTVYGNHEVVITHLHAGLFLGIVSLAVIVLGNAAFQRRDLN
jgi:hypothetical protein